MGLDMYIYEGDNEIAYFRKEPAIHDWFENLAIEKGIEFDSFNGVKVPLEIEDLHRLIDDLANKRLNYDASGFFFGSNKESENSNSWHNQMIGIFQRIIDESDEDSELFYDSWW